MKNLNIANVTKLENISPNMIRIRLQSEVVSSFSSNVEGGHIKLIIPMPDHNHAEFSRFMNSFKVRKRMRTYTVRHLHPVTNEIDIDFVAHGQSGPASAWAMSAKVGDFIGLSSAGRPKLKLSASNQYLIAVDMTALPAAAASVESLPMDARGNFYAEILSGEDVQPINAPEGIQVHWTINDTSKGSSSKLIQAIRRHPLSGNESIFVAGEYKMVGDLRSYFRDEKRYAKDQLYISSYWKHGLIESEHKRVKTLVA